MKDDANIFKAVGYKESALSFPVDIWNLQLLGSASRRHLYADPVRITSDTET